MRVWKRVTCSVVEWLRVPFVLPACAGEVLLHSTFVSGSLSSCVTVCQSTAG